MLRIAPQHDSRPRHPEEHAKRASRRATKVARSACSVLMMLRDAMLRIAPQHDRYDPVTLRSARSARLEGLLLGTRSCHPEERCAASRLEGRDASHRSSCFETRCFASLLSMTGRGAFAVLARAGWRGLNLGGGRPILYLGGWTSFARGGGRREA